MNLFTFCTVRQLGCLKLLKISGNCKYLKYCFKMVFLCKIQNKQCRLYLTMESLSFRLSGLLSVHWYQLYSGRFVLLYQLLFHCMNGLCSWWLMSEIWPISPEKRADTPEVLRQKGHNIAWFQKLRTLSRNQKKTTIWHEPKTVFYSLVSVVLINVRRYLFKLWRHRFSEIFFSKVFAISSLTCSEYNSYKTVCTFLS